MLKKMFKLLKNPPSPKFAVGDHVVLTSMDHSCAKIGSEGIVLYVIPDPTQNTYMVSVAFRRGEDSQIRLEDFSPPIPEEDLTCLEKSFLREPDAVPREILRNESAISDLRRELRAGQEDLYSLIHALQDEVGK